MIWISDIHLNFLPEGLRKEFYSGLKGETILITGDIAESHNVEKLLDEMYQATGSKIYFVAGNHDYYGSSIEEVKARLKKLKCAHYLPKSWGVKLDKHTALVGQDGWGDCRNGDYENSQLTMADWLYIKELNEGYRRDGDSLRRVLLGLADKDAEKLCKSVLKALTDKNVRKIIIATHVPPFEEVCLYAGKKSTPDGLPFFSSYILGFSMLPIIESHPEVDFLWLSGHTHSRASVQKRPNLTVKVAEAQYYFPQIEAIIE